MITLDMPPAAVRNSHPVRLESLMPGATAHIPGCPQIKRETVTVTAVQAWVFLHAHWCPTCMGRRM